MSSQIEVQPLTIRGQRFGVTVDGTGQFRAIAPDGTEAARAETRADLASQLDKRTRRAQATVQVPFIALDPQGRARRGTATGIHAGNGNVIGRWDGTTTTVQMARFGMGTKLLAGMDDADLAAGTGLLKAAQQAQNDWQEWWQAWILDLHKAVADAIREADSSDRP